MSLNAARVDLLAALETASIPAFYGWGAFATPCARVFPGEPWVALSGLAGGRRTQKWEVWAVAGRVDANASFDDLETLVQDINTAIDQRPQWGHIEWRRPAITMMAGIQYIACRGSIETLMEV